MKNKVEDYLKHIYDLEEGSNKVTVTVLAGRLNVTPASVTEMIKRLKQRALVDHRPYSAIRLTNKGKLAALRTLRKHRLWEVFLAKVLDFTWDEVHHEAEHFEHIMSDTLEQKIAAMLGEPAYDPHGAPIPRADGTLPDQDVVRTLASMAPGQSAQIVRVNDFNAELLRHLQQRGIALGKNIKIQDVRSFDGSVSLRIGKVECELSKQAAENIFVK